MIPEYLNHLEASLYLWSSIWYQQEDGIYGDFTFKIHVVEIVAAFVELFASFGWFDRFQSIENRFLFCCSIF